jgi:type IV pilus assembly protein PilM
MGTAAMEALSMALGEWRKKVMGEAKGFITTLGAPIGVDFGVGSLKVLQIAASDPLTLVSAACLPTPDEFLGDSVKRLTFQIDALPRLVRSAGFNGRRAVAAVPAAQSYCKHLQFQPEPGVTIPSQVRSAVPAQIGCDPSALVFRHIEIGPVGRTKAAEVICMAAARELVERFMRAMKDARLDPVGIHMEYTASLRAFESINRRADDAAVTSLYLDIGAGMTKVTMAHGKKLVFCRSIDLGGRHLDACIAKQLGVNLTQARTHRLQMADVARRTADAPAAAPAEEAAAAAKPAEPASSASGLAMLNAALKKAGEPTGGGAALMEDRRRGVTPPGHTPDLTRRSRMPMAPAWADLSEPLEILTDEISMCLRYYEGIFPDRRVDRAIFFGGESRHLGLCQHIARTLKLPAQVADPMAGIQRTGDEPTPGVDFRQPQPGWAMTLGLCLSPTDL